MTLSTQQRMTLEEYLTYDDGMDTCYELSDGVLVPMGTENPINPQITGFLFAIFLSLGIPHYRLVIGHQLEYQEQRFTQQQRLNSPMFPDLNLTAEQVLRAGK